VETAREVLDVTAIRWAHVIESDNAQSAGKGKRMSDEVGSSERWKPSVNPWLIAATFALAFMEVLDTSIANVALPPLPVISAPAPIREPGSSDF
jgi:hypothetical protein